MAPSSGRRRRVALAAAHERLVHRRLGRGRFRERSAPQHAAGGPRDAPGNLPAGLYRASGQRRLRSTEVPETRAAAAIAPSGRHGGRSQGWACRRPASRAGGWSCVYAAPGAPAARGRRPEARCSNIALHPALRLDVIPRVAPRRDRDRHWQGDRTAERGPPGTRAGRLKTSPGRTQATSWTFSATADGARRNLRSSDPSSVRSSRSRAPRPLGARGRRQQRPAEASQARGGDIPFTYGLQDRFRQGPRRPLGRRGCRRRQSRLREEHLRATSPRGRDRGRSGAGERG